jgi:hypothetical protein
MKVFLIFILSFIIVYFLNNKDSVENFSNKVLYGRIKEIHDEVNHGVLQSNSNHTVLKLYVNNQYIKYLIFKELLNEKKYPKFHTLFKKRMDNTDYTSLLQSIGDIIKMLRSLHNIDISLSDQLNIINLKKDKKNKYLFRDIENILDYTKYNALVQSNLVPYNLLYKHVKILRQVILVDLFRRKNTYEKYNNLDENLKFTDIKFIINEIKTLTHLLDNLNIIEKTLEKLIDLTKYLKKQDLIKTRKNK